MTDYCFVLLLALLISFSGPGLAAAEKGRNKIESAISLWAVENGSSSGPGLVAAEKRRNEKIKGAISLWAVQKEGRDEIEGAINLLTVEKKRDEIEGASGLWEVLTVNSSISAMSMALLPNNKIIILELGPSRSQREFQEDCWILSAEYDMEENKIRPLTPARGTLCSSGTLSTEGLLVQTRSHVKILSPWCEDGSCDWRGWSNSEVLGKRRYATNQILPDGRIIFVGGWRSFNCEFLPQNQKSQRIYNTLAVFNADSTGILYPFVHLAPDGYLFIFFNTMSIMYDYVKNSVLRQYPALPGGPRNFPSSGSSVLLPLDLSRGYAGFTDAEVLICGGAGHESSYKKAKQGRFLPASNTCGRLRFTDRDPHWVMEMMPMTRVMGDMLLLPTGDVLIINGASNGTAGYGLARGPVLQPLLYKTTAVNSRFEALRSSGIPRLHGSSCHLMPDGRVLVGGKNTNGDYDLKGDLLYSTDPILEAFSPPYLNPDTIVHRPDIRSIYYAIMGYDDIFTVSFFMNNTLDKEQLSVTIVAPSFTTHSYSMNQRLIKLMITELIYLPDPSQKLGSPGYYQISFNTPPNAFLAPPGYYLLFILHMGIPSPAKWVHLSDSRSSW